MSATSVRVLRRNALENDAGRQTYNGIALVRQHKIETIRLEGQLADARRTITLFIGIILLSVFSTYFDGWLSWVLIALGWSLIPLVYFRERKQRRVTAARIQKIIDHHWSRR